MANRSSNSRLLAIGFAVLVVGVVLVLVIIRNTDDQPAQPSPVATEQDASAEQQAESSTPMTPEQLSTARLPLPLDVPEGTEAMAVRADFMRSVAAIPSPGDLVRVYRYLAPGTTGGEADGDDAEGAPRVQGSPTSLPAPGPDSQQVLTDVEVLAVTGPLPAANDGVVTLVLAVPSEEVGGLMPLADRSELWFTIQPSPDDQDAPEDATEATEEPA